MWNHCLTRRRYLQYGTNHESISGVRLHPTPQDSQNGQQFVYANYSLVWAIGTPWTDSNVAPQKPLVRRCQYDQYGGERADTARSGINPSLDP